MSAAKMVILQPDAWIAAVSAVLTVMSDLRRTIGGSPVAPEFMDYLREQMAANTEALNALNATEVTATAVMGSNAARGTLADLDGSHLKTVIAAMQQLVKIQRGEKWATLGGPTSAAMVEALLFLESSPAANATTVLASGDDMLSAPPGIAAFILAMCDHANGTMIGPDVTEKLQAVYAWLRIKTRRTV